MDTNHLERHHPDPPPPYTPHLPPYRASQPGNMAFDTTQPLSSDWRNDAKSKERQRDAELELALEKASTKNLQNQLYASEHQRREEVKALETTIKNLTLRLTEESARSDDRLKGTMTAEMLKYDDLKERHSRLRKDHAALQAAVGRAGGGARGASDLETDLTSAKDNRFASQLELVERNTRLEGKRAYDALEKAKELQLVQLKERYESFLADSRNETAEFKSQLTKEQKLHSQTVRRLKSEVFELRKWSTTVNGIFRNIEEGAYPVVERGAWRSLRVPPIASAPGNKLEDANSVTTNTSRTAALSTANSNASEFLNQMEDKAMRTSVLSEFRTGNGMDTSLNDSGMVGGRETLKPRTSAPTQYGVSQSQHTDPYDTVRYTQENANYKASETFEMEAFKRHGMLIEEERTAVQEATLKELSSHPTVEYIRHLEDENKRVNEALSKERRSNSEARVALQSARRTITKSCTATASRATTATSRSSHKPRALSARPSRTNGPNGLSAFGLTRPVETFVGPPMSPDSFRATNVSRGTITKTSTDLTAHVSTKNVQLTSPEVKERVRVTTLTRDARRRAGERRDRIGVDTDATSASIGYLRKAAGATIVGARPTTAHSTATGRGSSGGGGSPGRSRPSSGRPGFGVGSGRRRESDTLPIPGRPLSGSAEVGYGFVLGDGPDKHGQPVGWRIGSDRMKHLKDRPLSRAQSARPSKPAMPTIEASEVGVAG